MKILVMGAGAIGAFFGARLKRAGEDVYFCARGENLRTLQTEGLSVKSPGDDFTVRGPATEDPKEYAPYDLVLLCVKSYDTIPAATQLVGCLNPGGAVMTLQNGVENEKVLREIFPAESVMAGNARISAQLVAPGRLEHFATGTIEFGELDGRETPRAMAIADVFRGAGILGKLADDIVTIRWHKLMGNNGTNTVCTLTRCAIGQVLKDPEGFALVRRLMIEAVTVARVEGARLDVESADRFLTYLRNVPTINTVRPSTLQDFERGKRLEYDAITGAVIRAGDRHGIDVPTTRTLHALLKLLDDTATVVRSKASVA
ncbi:MAG TPA: ketopantoate reductase family protein [Candidatus Latescibacteria bacterium]|nr:ketopantoate reductase family protein [Candidatus Latescibacterota bacterium]